MNAEDLTHGKQANHPLVDARGFEPQTLSTQISEGTCDGTVVHCSRKL